jgi:hypothetical protein
MRKVNKGPNFYLAILIAAVSIIAVLLAVTSSNSVKTMKNGSPEAAVQQYLQSVNEGRNEEAARYFSKISKCTVDDIDRAYIDNNAQVTLDKSVITSTDSAIVYVSIQRNNGPLLADTYTEQQTFRLNRENGLWKLAGIPWPLYYCGGEPK